MQCCFGSQKNWLSQLCFSFGYPSWELCISETCSIVCMLKALLKFPSPNHLLSMSNNGHKFESAIVSSTSNFESGICSSSRWHAAFPIFCWATQVGPKVKVGVNCLKKSMQKVASSLTWFGPSILSFANHHQYVDTCNLASNYLLICYSNSFSLLIKVGEQAELSKLHFWPNVQFSPQKARNRLPRRPLRCTPRGTSTSPLLLSGTSQRHSLLLHPLALTSSAPPFSSSTFAPPLRAMSAMTGGHSSWLPLHAELGQGMAMAGHGQGLAAPFCAYTKRRLIGARPLHSPFGSGHSPFVFCSVGRRRQGPRVRLIWIVLMGCGWFMENLGFPMQDVFSFSFVFADFWVKFGNA